MEDNWPVDFYEAISKISKERKLRRVVEWYVCLTCNKQYSKLHASTISDRPYWRYHFCSWKCFRDSVTRVGELKQKRRIKNRRR